MNQIDNFNIGLSLESQISGPKIRVTLRALPWMAFDSGLAIEIYGLWIWLPKLGMAFDPSTFDVIDHSIYPNAFSYLLD